MIVKSNIYVFFKLPMYYLADLITLLFNIKMSFLFSNQIFLVATEFSNVAIEHASCQSQETSYWHRVIASGK